MSDAPLMEEPLAPPTAAPIVPPIPTPIVLPALFVSNRVLAPKVALTLRVRGERQLLAARSAAKTGSLFVVAARNPAVQSPAPGDLYAVGTISKIVAAKWTRGEARLTLHGVTRARVERFTAREPHLALAVQPIDDGYDRSGDEECLSAMRRLAFSLLAKDPSYPPAVRRLVATVTDPHHLAELLAANLLHTVTEQQIILEAKEPADRIARMLRHLQRLEANPESRPLSAAEKWQRLWRALRGLFE